MHLCSLCSRRTKITRTVPYYAICRKWAVRNCSKGLPTPKCTSACQEILILRNYDVYGLKWVSLFETSFFVFKFHLGVLVLVLFRLTMSTFCFYLVLVSRAILVLVFVRENNTIHVVNAVARRRRPQLIGCTRMYHERPTTWRDVTRKRAVTPSILLPVGHRSCALDTSVSAEFGDSRSYLGWAALWWYHFIAMSRSLSSSS